MPNFKQAILRATEGELIESVVILNMLDDGFLRAPRIYGRDKRDTDALIASLNIPLSWEDAASLLDYEFNAGYGSMDCHDVIIYTNKSIHYVQEYDGSTWLQSIYKDPKSYTEAAKKRNANYK
jgi:hypothetical protein